jgi:glutamyl-tRNA reductase
VTKSFAVAKRVRSETAIGKNSASVASVAVNLASHIFGPLKGHPVLIVGAGKMAELAARHLREAQVEQIWVVNRTRARADALAERLGGIAYDWDQLESLLTRAAVVLCSTGAKEPVIRYDMVARAMKARRGRWLFLVDIALPRDVDPRAAELGNVYLYDIDALQQVVADNLKERQKEAEAAERIVGEELSRFVEGERTQGVVPTIKLLRELCQEVARKEAERVLPRLQGVTERDQKLIHQMAEAIVNKLLHGPLTALKRDAAQGGGPMRDLSEAVQKLWSLSEGSGADSGPARVPEPVHGFTQDLGQERSQDLGLGLSQGLSQTLRKTNG